MTQKIIAGIAGVLLVSLAVAGAFASGEGVDLLEETLVVDGTSTPGGEEATATPTEPEATETPSEAEATATPEDEATSTPGDPEATETPGPDATETPGPDVTATPGDGDGEDGGVHGIPDSNPSKHPEDGDGICEKGETVVKTTPSGNKVNVPCHAEKHRNHGDADGEGTEDDEEEDGAAGQNENKKKQKKHKGRGWG